MAQTVTVIAGLGEGAERMVPRHVVVLVGVVSMTYCPLLANEFPGVMPPPVTTVPAGQVAVKVQMLSGEHVCWLETCV